MHWHLLCRQRRESSVRLCSGTSLRLHCRSVAVTSLPHCSGTDPRTNIPKKLCSTTGCFFFSFYCVESKAFAVNLLCTFDVKISRRFCGGLCDGVSSVKVTKSCNQSLFIEILLCLFHPPPSRSSFQTVAVMWKGPWVVLESVNRWEPGNWHEINTLSSNCHSGSIQIRRRLAQTFVCVR